MEDIDGGLHPAVDGQSLDEMMRYTIAYFNADPDSLAVITIVSGTIPMTWKVQSNNTALIQTDTTLPSGTKLITRGQFQRWCTCTMLGSSVTSCTGRESWRGENPSSTCWPRAWSWVRVTGSRALADTFHLVRWTWQVGTAEAGCNLGDWKHWNLHLS